MKDPAKNMNIFEDLIEELKEENLIEATVINASTAKNAPAQPAERYDADAEELIFDATELMDESAAAEFSASKPLETVAPLVSEIVETESAAPAPAPTPSANRDNSEEIEFYRKRAVEEVAFLQMVESAFAGIERAQLKIVPTLYDDLEVKKVLHSYLQILPKASQSERSQAEFQLLQATENWYSTLAKRDQRILATHLRRYCETSRPPLSKPALIALARFYRNAPYTETVRSKFDLLMTRIFSYDDYAGKREMIFERGALVGHIKDLYAEWASVPLYSTDADDEGIRRTVQQFDEFGKEAYAVAYFDALINGNFFNRLRQFKADANEDFYAPPVAAAAIEMNVYVGNRYIELLEREKQRDGIEAVENKYGLINDSIVSETMSKTMSLVELLNQKQPPPPDPFEEEEEEFEEPSPMPSPSSPPPAEIVKTAEAATVEKNAKVAKWIFRSVIAFVLIVVIAFAFSFLYPTEVTTRVPVEIENSTLKNYLQSAEIAGDTLTGIVLPEWEKMSGEEKKQTLKTILTFGGEKGFRKVELVTEGQQKVGIADDTGGVFVVE